MAPVNPGLRPGLSSVVPVRQAQGRLYGTRFRDDRSHALLSPHESGGQSSRSIERGKLILAEVRASRTHRRPLRTTTGFEDREDHRNPSTSVAMSNRK